MLSLREIDLLWVMVAAGLVFMMQAGFLLIESGTARSKNSINVAIKNLTDLLIATIGFWLVGFGLMFGRTAGGWAGVTDFFASPVDGSVAAFFVFQLAFCGTAATINSGAIAERSTFWSYVVTSLMVSALVYPLFGHWAWGGALYGSDSAGWLQRMGFHDFAGSTVVHSIGGWFALVNAKLVGPREGRFDARGNVVRLQPSSLPLVYLGVILLVVGWVGFNGGSTLAANSSVASIVLKTLVAGAFGGVSCAAISTAFDPEKRVEPEFMANGMLGGLVAITAGCDVLSTPNAALLGAVSGLVVFAATRLLYRLRIDDVVGAFPVHGACGVVGTLWVGAFAATSAGQTRLEYLGVQALGVGVAALWASGTAYVGLKLIGRWLPLRVGAHDERIGLNVAEHGATSGFLDLAGSMLEATATGRYDASMKREPEPGTEVGDLTACFNQMVDAIGLAQQQMASEKQRAENVLDNMGDALITVDRQGRVTGRVSAAAEAWFGAADQQPVWEYLFLDEAQACSFEIGFEQILDDWLPFEVAVDQLPRRFRRDERELEVFLRQVGEGSSLQFIFVVRDITSDVKARAAQAEAAELALVVTNLVKHPADFRESLKEMESLLEAILGATDLQALRRPLHTLKGTAGVQGFLALAGHCHSLESELEEAEDMPSAEQLDGLKQEFAAANQRIAHFLQEEAEGHLSVSSAEYQHFMQRLHETAPHNELSRLAKDWSLYPVRQVLTRLARQAEAIATKLGKPLSVEVVDGDARVAESRIKPLSTPLVHIIRNAIDHGIETTEERVAAEKTPMARLMLHTSVKDSELTLTIRDDGRGLNWDAIRRRAQERGLPHETQADLERALFSDGFSTKDEASEMSGRGVGLSAVAGAVQDLGGRLEVLSESGKGTQFICRIPAQTIPPLAS